MTATAATTAVGGVAPEERQALRSLAGDVFGGEAAGTDVAGRRVPLDAARWALAEETGLSVLAVPEPMGGGGGTVGHLAVVLREAGRCTAAVPLAEAQLLAGWLLEQAGLPLPAGPLTASTGPALTCERTDAGWAVHGVLDRVAWGMDAAAVVALARAPGGAPAVVSVPAGVGRWEPGSNIAGEGRDRLVLGPEPVVAGHGGLQVAPLPGEPGEELRWRAAIGRACLILGALDRALDLTVAHVGEREQFGRPLGRFQAVQQGIASMAAAVRAAGAAVDGATTAVERAGFGDAASVVATMAAKSEANRSAREVARSAHQLLGAIGFTDEHGLHRATTRLWAWSQEDGTDPELHDGLGLLAALRESVWGVLVVARADGPAGAATERGGGAA